MAKIDYDNLTKQIVEYVGGVENIKTITHCVTRLRLYLNDRNKAEDEKIKNLPGVFSSTRLFLVNIYSLYLIILKKIIQYRQKLQLMRILMKILCLVMRRRISNIILKKQLHLCLSH
jgi:glucose-like phosphotransferase system IIB component